MNAAQVNLGSRSVQDVELRAPEEIASALMDGEVDVDRLDGVFASDEVRSKLFSSWNAYQVIGDSLRGNAEVVASQPPGDFLSTFRERLQAEAAQEARPSIPLESYVPRPVEALVRVPAANDAVFRWKLVAGFASLAAVMAVSWTVLSSAPSAGGQVGPQLAAAPVPAQAAVPVAVAPSPSTEVVVNTGQGPLIRDARLEELLAEHRQNGGMSALQMPTGFIRNATYDAAGR